MRVGVLGINHKLAGLELRELLAKTCQKRLAPGTSTHGEHFFVLLSTCNRTEVYFSSEELADTHSYLLNILRQDVYENFDQKLYSYFGYDCLMHLCRVTAGLDSAIVAETEIQGQVKTAYEATQEYIRLPYELHYLFQKSLGIAKKVRGVLPLKPGLPGIEHAIFQTGQHFFQAPQDRSILFVGASDINEKVLAHFKHKNLSDISLCNRSQDAGQSMAEKYNIPFISWDAMQDWSNYDWIIFGTKAPDFLINPSSIPGSLHSKKLLIDLSVPRNVDPSTARHPMITLLNIDQINRHLHIRQKHMQRSLDLAEDLINQATENQMQLFKEKEAQRFKLCTAFSA